MTELSARLGLYVAIDHAAREEDRLHAAAAVIPVYRLDFDGLGGVHDGQGAMGWSDHLEDLLVNEDLGNNELEWARTRNLDEALRELADLNRPSELDQARRLKAMWALTRAVPPTVVETNLDPIAAVLTPVVQAALAEPGPPAVEPTSGPAAPNLGPDGVLPRVRVLVELLSDPARYTTAEEWPQLVQTAAEQGLISTNVAELAAIGCEDWVTFVPVTRDGRVDVDPAARIVSKVIGFDVGTLTLDDIKAALRPDNWPRCLATFWCAMRKLEPPASMAGGPITTYQEVVGDCPAEWFHPYLRFATRDLVDPTGSPNGFELQYDLCRPADLQDLRQPGAAPLQQDARVEVDSGKIIIVFRQRPGQPAGHHEIDITTSKTIRFSQPLPTGGIALFACISGWADHTRMMMSGCLGTGLPHEETP